MWQQEDRGRMSLPFISPRLCDLEVSFEFFPPKTPKMEETLWKSIDVLAPLTPKFVSVTYGAGGTTRARTHEIVTNIHKKTGLNAAAHLTCIGASREEIDEIASGYWNSGIRHIVALRGDLQQGKDAKPVDGGYKYASELVAGLKKIAPFEISVAGYPEIHPEAINARADMDNLKKKVDAGADRIITQFFMEPDMFLNFRDRAVAAGINVPIVPGVLSFVNLEFATKCGAKVPEWMSVLFQGLDDQLKTRQLIAATVTAEMCRVLYANGIRNFHFYTLNRAEHTLAICHMLGLRAAQIKPEQIKINA
jgi:methylenetetrahydrofolate reductase (NADPH)